MSDNRAQRRARRHAGRPVQGPDGRTEALRTIAAAVNRTSDEQQLREMAIEIATGMRELAESRLLGLSDEQRQVADRAIVAYMTWWCEQHNLEPPTSDDQPPLDEGVA